MFIFKYIVPQVGNLYKIKATHEISMFIMSKKSYIELKELVNDMRNKKNFKKIDKYWNEFVSSQVYKELLSQFESDL